VIEIIIVVSAIEYCKPYVSITTHKVPHNIKQQEEKGSTNTNKRGTCYKRVIKDYA
jgi:hypothetical protein